MRLIPFLVFNICFAGFGCQITPNVMATIKSCIPGVQIKTTHPEVSDPTRQYFEIQFEQSIDHSQPVLGTFRQKLILAHRDYTEPMVLQTSGYSIFRIAPSRLTLTFDTNQIQVEHRFFRTSSPSPKDWSKLNVEQSAQDFHRIVMAFKPIYDHAWVNTGASKGGMTSIYHRRFYPADLDGTLADVAPNSFSNLDERYITFLDSVGGEPYRDCREKLSDLQRHLLTHRQTFEASLTGDFQHLGGVDIAFEHAVQEMPFYYWQYHNPKDSKVGCDHIPTSQSSNSTVLKFLEKIANVSGNYGDSALLDFGPYFYQAATQLGSPALKRSHLTDLLLYPFHIDQYVPKGLQVSYSPSLMKDIADWLRDNGRRMMLTYGEFDPWSAGMFTEQCSQECYWNMVPGENHRASIFYLPEAQKQTALQKVSEWVGKRADGRTETSPNLETLEFEFRRSHPKVFR